MCVMGLSKPEKVGKTIKNACYVMGLSMEPCYALWAKRPKTHMCVLGLSMGSFWGKNPKMEKRSKTHVCDRPFNGGLGPKGPKHGPKVQKHMFFGQKHMFVMGLSMEALGQKAKNMGQKAKKASFSVKIPLGGKKRCCSFQSTRTVGGLTGECFRVRTEKQFNAITGRQVHDSRSTAFFAQRGIFVPKTGTKVRAMLADRVSETLPLNFSALTWLIYALRTTHTRHSNHQAG